MNVAEQFQDGVVRRVLTGFRTRFLPDGAVVWVAERDAEPMHASHEWLGRMRLSSAAAKELPNVVFQDVRGDRLCLVDVAELGRQVTPQRRDALRRLVKRSPGEALFVTAFKNRNEFQRLVIDPPWGTVAWFADEPEHIVVFDDVTSSFSLQPAR